MMRRAAILSAAMIGTVAAPAAAQAEPHGSGHGPVGAGAPGMGAQPTVAIANRAYSPARLTALAGDTVSWRNDDLLPHNVSAAGGAIASGTLARGDRFAHRFEATGSYPYLCTIHPFMQGQVDVHGALLHGPSGPVLAGRAVDLHGRAAAGSSVTLTRRVAGEASFTPVTAVTAGADGAFHVSVHPAATAAYQALTAAGASPAVTIAVTSKLHVRVTTQRGPRFTRVRVLAPGAGHARATVQLYSRERFTWKDRDSRRLDAEGRTTFRLRAGLRYHARVVLTHSGSHGVIASSRRFKLPR